MKTDDVQCVYDPDWHRTDKLYVPESITAQSMTLRQLLPGLCSRADLKGEVCGRCNGCGFGRRLVELADTARAEGWQRTGKAAEQPSTTMPAGVKLAHGMTKAQLERVERMKAERRERVTRVQEMINQGMHLTRAVLLAGYSNPAAYIKALKKCEEEKTAGGQKHV